jgi:hemerythrin
MEAIQWSEAYSVGHSDIDQQHKQLFLLFAKMVKGIDGQGTSIDMDQSFVQLCGYVKNHFRYEERLMKKAAYPDLEEHKQKHEKIKDKLREFRKDFNKASGKKQDAIAEKVAKFLQEWLQGHIKGDDQEYIPYVSQPEAAETTAIKQFFTQEQKTSTFVWSDAYSVGNRKIDSQHKRLFAMFDGLLKAIHSGDSIFGVEKVFLQMRGYVKNHFRFEESLMKKNRYPGYKEHRAKHDLICDTIKSYRTRFNTESKLEKEELAMEVASFFEEWLKVHIKDEDQQYTSYIKD